MSLTVNQISRILTDWADRGGDVFYEKANVLKIVADIEKVVSKTGRVTLTRIPGNGAEMGAAIAILEGEGCKVTTKREEFNKRILSMTVTGKPTIAPKPATMNSTPRTTIPEIPAKYAGIISSKRAASEFGFDTAAVVRLIVGAEAAAARDGSAVVRESDLRRTNGQPFNGFEATAVLKCLERLEENQGMKVTATKQGFYEYIKEIRVEKA